MKTNNKNIIKLLSIGFLGASLVGCSVNKKDSGDDIQTLDAAPKASVSKASVQKKTGSEEAKKSAEDLAALEKLKREAEDLKRQNEDLQRDLENQKGKVSEKEKLAAETEQANLDRLAQILTMKIITGPQAGILEAIGKDIESDIEDKKEKGKKKEDCIEMGSTPSLSLSDRLEEILAAAAANSAQKPADIDAKDLFAQPDAGEAPQETTAEEPTPETAGQSEPAATEGQQAQLTEEQKVFLSNLFKSGSAQFQNLRQGLARSFGSFKIAGEQTGGRIQNGDPDPFLKPVQNPDEES